MKNDIKLLNNKERLSVPEIQAYMNCDYAAAKKYCEKKSKPEGLFYTILFLRSNIFSIRE